MNVSVPYRTCKKIYFNPFSQRLIIGIYKLDDQFVSYPIEEKGKITQFDFICMWARTKDRKSDRPDLAHAFKKKKKKKSCKLSVWPRVAQKTRVLTLCALKSELWNRLTGATKGRNHRYSNVCSKVQVLTTKADTILHRNHDAHYDRLTCHADKFDKTHFSKPKTNFRKCIFRSN